jgi:hypothetical protein
MRLKVRSAFGSKYCAIKGWLFTFTPQNYFFPLIKRKKHHNLCFAWSWYGVGMELVWSDVFLEVFCVFV